MNKKLYSAVKEEFTLRQSTRNKKSDKFISVRLSMLFS